MKKFVKIHHFLIRSLSAGQKFISLLLNYKVLSVQLGVFLGLLLINANYFACLNIKAATTSTLEEVINPSYLDINNGTGSVQVELPIKQVNTPSEIQVSAAPQLQQLNINPLLQVITVPPLLRSNSDYEKTGTDQPTSGPGWIFSDGVLILDSNLAEPKTKQNQDGSWTTIWPWDGLRSQVTKVEIKSEIKVTNTSSMFARMPQLSTVNGLNKLDSIKYMNAMFDGDWMLTDVDVSNWDLTQVQECSYLFSGCRSLTTIKGGFSTSSFQNTTTMSAMFFDCSALTNVDVSKWDVKNVADFSSMFRECSALQSIKGLDNWNTTAATNMSYMFASDISLTELDLSKFDTSNVTTFDSMFTSDIALTSLNVSNFKTDKVKSFSNMFSSCKALKSITGLDTWETTGAIFDKPTGIDMSLMFAYNDNLETLNLSKFDTSNVISFYAMFFYCTKLTSIAGLNNWKTKSATNMYSMFAGCKNLESITGLDNWDTTAATNMSSMFASATSLQKLDLSSFDTRNATQDNFFSGDTNLWYLKMGKDTKLNKDCGLPEAPKDTYFPSEFPKEPENPKNPEYKTSQNGKWQKVIKKEEDDYWWQPNDDIYTNDEVIKDSQSNDDKLFIWQPAFSQTTKGSLVLNVNPSNIHFNIILGNKNKNEFSDDEMKLHYDVQSVGSSDAQWQLYAMMTKFKNNDPSSNTVLSIDILSLSLEDGVSSGQKYDLNQQPTLIRTSAENSSKWDLKPVLNVGNLDKIKNDGSSGTKTYTTTIDYDLVNSIQ